MALLSFFRNKNKDIVETIAPAAPPPMSVRPFTPLYRPGERFEISAAGLVEWQQSEAFKRIVEFYHEYPKESLQSNEARAFLHHLIVMRRPEKVLEIGTFHAGTTEVMARALAEVGHGHLETIDPFGAERVPPRLAAFPPELRERVSFWPVTSSAHFDRAISESLLYDFVLVDGNHEYEYALFDLLCAARLIKPGGLIVLDNIEQPGPRFATKVFLEEHPQWRDVSDVVRRLDPADPFAMPPASFPDTKFYLIEAPSGLVVDGVPRSFGGVTVDRAEVDGIELELAAPARGVLHVQVYARSFAATGMMEPEELEGHLVIPLDFPALPENPRIRLPLDKPLRTGLPQPGLLRRVEIVLAFIGDQDLLLCSPPTPYPAQRGKSIGL